MDKKSKEERDKLDADLDAMLNEVQFPLPSVDELEEDEDAIDRLLKNAGFDGDQELKNDSDNSEPDLSGFDSLSDDYVPEPSITDLESEGFSELVDSKRAEILTEITVKEEQLVKEDKLDEFLGLADDFIESDLIEDEEEQNSLSNSALPDSLATASSEDRLGDFSDFNDFIEPEPVLQDPEETTTEKLEPDEIDEYFGLANGFDLSDMIDADPGETPAASVVKSSLPSEKEEIDTDNEFDNFTDFSDFAEPEIIVQDSIEEIQQETTTSEDTIDDLFSTDVTESFNEESEDSILGDDFSGGAMNQELEDSGNVKPDLPEQLSEDEVAMDQLFGDEGVVYSEITETKDNLSDENDFNEVENFFKLNEVSDDFSVQIEDQLVEAEKLSTQDAQGDDFLLPDFDISDGFESAESDAVINEGQIDVSFADTDFLDQDDTQEDVLFDSPSFVDEVFQTGPEPEKTLMAEKFEEPAKNVRSDSDNSGQEDFKKQLEEANSTVKKTKKLVYIALGFGVAAISTAVGLGVMAYNAKKEVAQLTETVTALEAGLVKMAQSNADKEVNTMVSSVVQLNQQVYGFITDLKGNAQLPVDFLDNKVAGLVAKQDMVSKALASLEMKMGDALDNVSLQPIVLEAQKPEAAKEPENVAVAPVKDNALNKGEVAHSPAKEVPAVAEAVLPKKEIAKEQIAAKEKVKPATATAKPEPIPPKIETKSEKSHGKAEATPTPTPAKVKVQTEEAVGKPIPVASSTLKQEAEKLRKQQAQVPGKWGVNLVAFKQEWFAKSKAAEFARQGIYAEVFPVTGNNSTLYRLRVGGFKSKAEATASKDKIKKLLNLDSVWVSDN